MADSDMPSRGPSYAFEKPSALQRTAHILEVQYVKRFLVALISSWSFSVFIKLNSYVLNLGSTIPLNSAAQRNGEIEKVSICYTIIFVTHCIYFVCILLHTVEAVCSLRTQRISEFKLFQTLKFSKVWHFRKYLPPKILAFNVYLVEIVGYRCHS